MQKANMGSEDPKGYYKILGVHPDAPASVIKAAYRALAMDLHPDRNPGKDTTVRFQALQEAYAVISDEKLRQQYDADSSIPIAETSADKGNTKPFEPVVCSRCGAISAQPRYKVFYTVYGYFVGASRQPHQGVYCAKCEIKVALKSSAITLVAGWWSIPGFIWTLQTLFENLVGGQFNQQNAQLQGHQALYFAQAGKVELARAIAVEALKLAQKATKERSKESRAKKKLGYDDADPLESLKGILTRFISTVPADAELLKLKSTNGVFNRRFLFQAVLIVTFFGLISGELYRQERQAAAVERARLEKLGIERAKAAAIAASEAQALKSMEQPLPENGIFDFVDRRNFNPRRSPPLKIMNAPGANTLMKLTRVGDGAEVMSVFIRAGQTIEVAVPVGSYKAKLASGQTWYGDSIRFGPATSYSTLDAVLDFTIEGTQLMGHEITLTRVKHGNLKQLPLNAADF